MEMPQKRLWKRTHYLTNKSIQLKYVGLNLLFMSWLLLFSMFIIYYGGWASLVEKLSNVYPQGRLMTMLSAIYLRLLTGFLVVAPVAIIATILLSHKVAGPLVRINRYLNEIASGNLSMRLKLRKGDELQEVADAINAVGENLGNRINESVKGINKLLESIEILKKESENSPLSPEITQRIEQIADVAQSIKDKLSKFQLTEQ